MKITAFNPFIITPKADETIEVFEALGFERRHQKDGINDEDISSVDLKNPDGFRMNVAHVAQMPQAMTCIRMSVRDFDEAYKILESHGFKNAQGDKITDTGTSKATMMVSPSGFSISLSQHIRKEDKE
jgi:predicted RNA binding protein YcfA (HicA-like mRNA interferase family)